MRSGGHQTADEAKAECIAKLGADLGEHYSALWQELAWIHSKWVEYVTLFGANEQRIEMLNETAPRFFRTVQDSLWEDVLLHLARLTDSPRSAGKDNLSVRRLPSTELLKAEPQFAQLVAASVSATNFARDWRNRRLAHRDLALALGKQVEPLAPASRLAVSEALTALVAVMNWIAGKFLDTTTMFDMRDTDAEALLYVIRDGLRFDTERRERVKSGQWRSDDLKPEPL